MAMANDPTVFLERWSGGAAKLWRYTVSHKGLTIRVEYEGRRGNLHIYCGDVSFICGPTNWQPASLEIGRSGEEWVVRDKSAGFEVRGGVVEVKENCKPIY